MSQVDPVSNVNTPSISGTPASSPAAPDRSTGTSWDDDSDSDISLNSDYGHTDEDLYPFTPSTVKIGVVENGQIHYVDFPIGTPSTSSTPSASTIPSTPSFRITHINRPPHLPCQSEEATFSLAQIGELLTDVRNATNALAATSAGLHTPFLFFKDQGCLVLHSEDVIGQGTNKKVQRAVRFDFSTNGTLQAKEKVIIRPWGNHTVGFDESYQPSGIHLEQELNYQDLESEFLIGKPELSLKAGTLDALYVVDRADTTLSPSTQKRSGKSLTHEEKIRGLCGVVKGVAYLHQMGIVHRDLKPDNMFIYRDENSLKGKLGDLGSLRPINIDRQDDMFKYAGITIPYAAPELGLQNAPIQTSADIWSLGLSLCEIFNNDPIILNVLHVLTEAKSRCPLASISGEAQLEYLANLTSNEKQALQDEIDRAFALSGGGAGGGAASQTTPFSSQENEMRLLIKDCLQQMKL